MRVWTSDPEQEQGRFVIAHAAGGATERLRSSRRKPHCWIRDHELGFLSVANIHAEAAVKKLKRIGSVGVHV